MRIFPLCISVWQQSHLIFPPGSQGVTEPLLFLWLWKCGFKRKIPVLSGMLNCWVPESENILPATNLGKQSSPDSGAKWFFGRLTPLRIKDIGVQPSGQAGTGPGQDTGILVEPEILSVCLYQLLTLVLKGELPKMWANGPWIDKSGIIFLAIFRGTYNRDFPFWPLQYPRVT